LNHDLNRIAIVICPSLTTTPCLKKWHWCSTLQLRCRSNNFNYFWQRYCWESILSMDDLLSHLF